MQKLRGSASIAKPDRKRRVGRTGNDWIEEATHTTFTRHNEPCPWWSKFAKTDDETTVAETLPAFVPECCTACFQRGSCNHEVIRAHKVGKHKDRPEHPDDCMFCAMESEGTTVGFHP